jgi:hypothetical protein
MFNHLIAETNHQYDASGQYIHGHSHPWPSTSIAGSAGTPAGAGMAAGATGGGGATGAAGATDAGAVSAPESWGGSKSHQKLGKLMEHGDNCSGIW